MDDFWTSEDPPRRVTVKGRAALDPDCMVVEVEGLKKPITGIWMYPTGYLHPIGVDIFAGETPEKAKTLKQKFTPVNPRRNQNDADKYTSSRCTDC